MRELVSLSCTPSILVGKDFNPSFQFPPYLKITSFLQKFPSPIVAPNPLLCKSMAPLRTISALLFLFLSLASAQEGCNDISCFEKAVNEVAGINASDGGGEAELPPQLLEPEPEVEETTVS